MLKILKLLTKSGRQEIVREAAVQILTVENIAELGAQGVNALLQKVCSGIDDEKMKLICARCADGGEIFSAVSTAAADKVITAEEAKDICEKVKGLTGAVVTQETIDSVIAKIVAKVP